jgi:hypothetical protein
LDKKRIKNSNQYSSQIIALSHHELGIPIVAPGPSSSGFYPAKHSTPSFHLTSFNTRSFQLSSVPPNPQSSGSRGILVAGSIPMFGANQDLEDEYEDDDQFEGDDSLGRENQIESLGVVSEVGR